MSPIDTKFGKAYKTVKGYYLVQLKNGRRVPLHRLIFEDFYNIKLEDEFDEEMDIHHIDGDKTNNEIWNLMPISHSDHQRLHRKGVKSSDETKLKISKVKNNQSGYFRVSKKRADDCLQGFRWRYRYRENGKEKTMYSVDLNKLKEKVLSKGLLWKEVGVET